MKTKVDIKREASRYVKIVEWSDEDGCYVGLCPELFGGGTHGDDELKVYADLTAMVEEAIEDRLVEGRELPEPAIPQQFSGKFLLRTGPELHKALSIRAYREGKSLNAIVVDAIKAGIEVT
jgi:predicted HicB family RNase H-like nuclease